MKKILVIDNQLGENHPFTSLNSDVYQVHISEGIENGLAIADRYQPNLIICNIADEEEGLHLLGQLIQSDRTQNIPIIYLTMKADFNHQRTIMNAGADDYFLKPFTAAELGLAIERRLTKHFTLREEVRQSCFESFEAEGKPPVANDHILVTIGNRLQLIRYEQIVCITALREYSRIRTFEGQKIVVRKSLKSWVDFLPTKGFL